MNAIYDDVRQNIAEIRDQRGYTQSQLARALKLPQPTYAGYEMGLRKFPLHIIKRIAVFFGVTIDSLCEEYSAPGKPDVK